MKIEARVQIIFDMRPVFNKNQDLRGYTAMNYVFVLVLIGYVVTLLQKAIVLNVTNVQWSIKRLFLTVTVIYLPHVIVFHFLIPDSVISLESAVSWMVLLTFAYRLSFKQSWRKSIFMTVGQYFILSAGFEYIAVFTSNQMPDNVRVFLFENSLIIIIPIAFIYLLIFLYTRKYADKDYSLLDYLVSKYWKEYVIFFSLFAIYDVIILLKLEDIQDFNSKAEVLVVVLFIIFFMHILKHIKTNHQLDITQRELETQQIYAESQEKTLNDLRGFKHDLNNILYTINGLINSGETEKLKTFLEEITAQHTSPQTTEASDNVKRIPILSGILTEKIARAEMKGITFNLRLMEDDINLKYCSDLDYSRIIGILLDNAIEAAEISTLKKIELLIYVESGMLHNVIINSCDKEVDISRIFEHGYSTKSVPSGEGLYQLRLIQKKYNKVGSNIEIIPKLENGFFTQVLKF